MTNWIEWNGGECPIKSDKTVVDFELRNGSRLGGSCKSVDWFHSFDDPSDIIAYRIIEDYEPVAQTREQITAQIEALRRKFHDQIDVLQKKLDDLPKTKQYYWFNGELIYSSLKDATYTFDIETINGVPHIHGVAMIKVGK
jgi:hypothetical protein